MATKLRLSGKHPLPLNQRGRMLFVEDVLSLLSERSGGRLVRSRWWVLNNFAPEYKRKIGRDPYWWESDVAAWLDKQGGEAA